MAFARHQFELSEKQQDGATLRVHLEAVWEKTGEPPAMLRDAPPMPAGCSQLWNDFLELHSCRGSSFGASRITFLDIAAWQSIRGVKLQPWEIDCIRRTDEMWLSEFQPTPEETVQ